MKALVVTAVSFPYGSAMSDRIRTFCMLFNDLGYDVHVIAAKKNKQDEYGKTYDLGFCTYETVKTNRSEQIQSYIGNENIIRVVNNYLDNNEVSFVFHNALGAIHNRILNIIKKHNVKNILEQCEWFDDSCYRLGKVDPRYLRFKKNFSKNNLKSNGVISISHLLDNYYSSNGVKSLIIPSIFDVQSFEYNELSNNDKIKLVYTGSVGRSKELLKPILCALNSKEIYKEKIEMNIYGINEKDVLVNIGNDIQLLKELKNVVSIKGRVPYSELKTGIMNSNYSIFIKPVKRLSNAQFPTKLAESMSYGTPVICNDTGDISLYLKNEYNGFICDSDDICKTFDRIIDLDRYAYNQMRANARKTAEESFDYRNYIDDVRKLIEEL